MPKFYALSLLRNCAVCKVQTKLPVVRVHQRRGREGVERRFTRTRQEGPAVGDSRKCLCLGDDRRLFTACKLLQLGHFQRKVDKRLERVLCSSR